MDKIANQLVVIEGTRFRSSKDLDDFHEKQIKMDELSILGKKYGTDKIGKHNYLPVYYEMFKNRRQEVKNVIEIGVGEGLGLLMWRDFFPNAHIWGFDNEDYRASFVSERIECFKLDQSKCDGLRDVANNFFDTDLIVDDGSHKSSDQVFSCLLLMPNMINATYVIEDVSEPSIVGILERYLPQCQVIVKTCGKRYDDRLIIVKHKNG